MCREGARGWALALGERDKQCGGRAEASGEGGQLGASWQVQGVAGNWWDLAMSLNLAWPVVL